MKKIIFAVVILTLFLMPAKAHAIYINHNWGQFATVSNWIEDDILTKNENSMYTDITFSMIIEKNITTYSKKTDLNFTIRPKEAYWNNEIKKENIFINVSDVTSCLGDSGGNSKLNYDFIDGDKRYNEFVLRIKINDSDFGKCDYKQIDVSLKYKIENYLQKQGYSYLAFLQSDIFPKKPNNIRRTLNLNDEKFIIKDLPSHLMPAAFRAEDGGIIWRIDTDEYRSDFIYIENTEETKYLTQLYWNVIYSAVWLFAGVIITLLIEHGSEYLKALKIVRTNNFYAKRDSNRHPQSRADRKHASRDSSKRLVREKQWKPRRQSAHKSGITKKRQGHQTNKKITRS